MTTLAPAYPLIHSSRGARDFPLDPEPWLVTLAPRIANGRYRTWRGAADDWDDALARAEAANPTWTAYSGFRLPRPEYGFREPIAPRSNVLPAIRDEVQSIWAGDTAEWLRQSILPDLPYGYLAEDPDEYEHAARVVARLARWFGVAA